MKFLGKFEQSRTFGKFLKRYFHDYGGASAVFGSPLFLTSVALTAVSYREWLGSDWPNTTMSVIPNLLGFSLGTYALLFSLISPRIRLALRSLRNNRGVRYLDEMNATFLHFIMIQVASFIWAFAYKQTFLVDLSRFIARNFPSELNLMPLAAVAGSVIGTTLLIYSVLLVIGASLTVYRIAKIVDPDPS